MFCNVNTLVCIPETSFLSDCSKSPKKSPLLSPPKTSVFSPPCRKSVPVVRRERGQTALS